jgi:hypothetical protein
VTLDGILRKKIAKQRVLFTLKGEKIETLIIGCPVRENAWQSAMKPPLLKNQLNFDPVDRKNVFL